ncbi:hypothetical protein [Desulfovibrio sp. JC022]|uniref:hypothetical protein n=1 Tax=Desulfovibrio sp. JC022 TaxID=2593642 RepID=UPI0013D31CCB|nr:hypothetical protein [Desulfovibrio sp. JC022]NDV21429.1 hypothetical protein [Desulfovibrio sp. JC022]
MKFIPVYLLILLATTMASSANAQTHRYEGFGKFDSVGGYHHYYCTVTVTSKAWNGRWTAYNVLIDWGHGDAHKAECTTRLPNLMKEEFISDRHECTITPIRKNEFISNPGFAKFTLEFNDKHAAGVICRSINDRYYIKDKYAASRID